MQLTNADFADVMQPISGDARGKNLLSIYQLSAADIFSYIEEAYAAASLVYDADKRGISLLPHTVLKAVMRQPSTRTGGSCTTAMRKLGGHAELISGMSSSSEAKGETMADSWVAFATQSDIIGTRTAEDFGPHQAAKDIKTSYQYGGLQHLTPIINLGDGRNEHPTQALGDLFTIHRRFTDLKGLTLVMVGDHERYRAFHSLFIGAVTLGMKIIAVESKAAPLPEEYIKLAGDKLTISSDLDDAMSKADVLYIGRNPDEYDGTDKTEKARSEQLAADYKTWIVDKKRLQKMPKNSIVLHPRPRRDELHPSIDDDPRAADVEQMANMVPMRMAIFARHLGVSIKDSL